MWNIAKEATLGFTKKITQFIGLILFIIGSVLTFTALFSTVFQVKNSLNNIKKNSFPYQYEIQIDNLNIDNNVWKKKSKKINENNRSFLAQFYDENKIDFNSLTFNNVRTNILELNCDLTNNEICTWSKKPEYLNKKTGTASFTALIKNFNSNIVSAFLSYIIHNPVNSRLNYIIDNKKVSLELSFNVGYQFAKNNLKKDTHYFNATAVNKDNNLLFNGDGWRGNNIFYTPFNRLFEITKKKPIIFLDKNNIILNKQYIDYNHLKIGDNFNLGNNTDLQFNIIGCGAKYNNIYPDLVNLSMFATNNKIIDLKNGSILFMNYNNFNAIKYNFLNGTEKITAFINVKGDLTNSQKNALLRKVLNNYFVFSDNSITPFELSLSGQVVMLTNAGFIINTSIAIACSIVILIIIVFFIKKDITNKKQQIGVLKSLGYNNFELSFIFIFNIIFITLISCLLGWILSVPLQIYFTTSNLFSVGLPLSLFYFNLIIFISVTFIIPFIFVGISFLISIFLLNYTALDLIYDLKKYNLNFFIKKIKKSYTYIRLGLTFNIYLSFTFALKSLGKWIMVLIILTFSYFLLIFQLDIDVMTKNFIKEYFRYFKNDIKSYLIATYDQQYIAQKSKNNKTYQWIAKNERENYYHEAKILDDNKTFNFPNPLICFINLYAEIKNNTKKECGDLLNIIGNPNEPMVIKSKINYDDKTKTYPYISSETVKSIVNYKIKDYNTNKLINGWNNLIKIINLIKPSLIKKGINEYNIQKIISLINWINNLSSLNINNQYPEIYLGSYMVYDKIYDFPYIFLVAGWNSDDYKNSKNPVSQLNIIGLSSEKLKRNKLLNYRSKTISTDVMQKELFDYKINDKPTSNNPNNAINEAIPVILSKRVYQSMKLTLGDTFKLNVNITNEIGYVPILFKFIGSNDADISSGNIYMNQESLIIVMNQWVNLTKKGKKFLPNSYFNVIASYPSSLGVILQPYRIMSLFSLTNNYNLTMFDNNKKFDFKNVLDLITNLKLLNGFNNIWPFDILRENYLQWMKTIRNVINVLEIITIIIISLIIAVLISMVLDENRQIILILKALGYQTIKIIAIVLGFYLFAIIIGYVSSYIIAQLLWNVIANIIFKSTGMLLIPSFSFYVISIATLAISIILILAISVSIWKIKKNKLTNITLE